jgi:hypothetical protein
VGAPDRQHPLDEAALIERLSVAHHAVARSGAKTGDVALVGGSGPIGLLTAAVLKGMGVTMILSELTQARKEKVAHASPQPAAPMSYWWHNQFEYEVFDSDGLCGQAQLPALDNVDALRPRRPSASTASASADPMSVDSQRLIRPASPLDRTAAPSARSNRSRRSCTATVPERLSTPVYELQPTHHTR